MYKGQTDKKRHRDASGELSGMSIRASGFTANLGEIEFIKIKGMREEAKKKFLNISAAQCRHMLQVMHT